MNYVAEEINDGPVFVEQNSVAGGRRRPSDEERYQHFETLGFVIDKLIVEKVDPTVLPQDVKDLLVRLFDTNFPYIAAYIWTVMGRCVAFTAHRLNELTVQLGSQPMFVDFQWRNTDVFVTEEEGDEVKIAIIVEALIELRKVGFPGVDERRYIVLPSGAGIRVNWNDVFIESKAWREGWD
jgi:hypothetical protein